MSDVPSPPAGNQKLASSETRQTRYFDCLPAELVTEIFEWVGEERRHQLRQNTLSRLCLTSKRFLPQAQRLLFHRLELPDPECGGGEILEELVRDDNLRNLSHVRSAHFGDSPDLNVHDLAKLADGAVDLQQLWIVAEARCLSPFLGSHLTTLFLAQGDLGEWSTLSLPQLAQLGLSVVHFSRDIYFDLPRLKHLVLDRKHDHEPEYLDKLAPNLVSCSYDGDSVQSLPRSIFESRSTFRCIFVWSALNLEEPRTKQAHALKFFVVSAGLLARCVDFVNAAEHTLVAVVLPLEAEDEPAIYAQLVDACSRRHVQLVQEDVSCHDWRLVVPSPWVLRTSEQRHAAAAQKSARGLGGGGS